MKKLIVTLTLILGCSGAYAASLKLTTSSWASVEKVGNKEKPGLLLKFELPAELQNARIDLACLRFQVNPDTTQTSLGLLVRPMLVPWVPAMNLSTLPDSAASLFHVNTGRASFKTGAVEAEVTLAIKTWQKGELYNLGFLTYSAEETTRSLRPKNLPGGGVAELEIFYTPEERK